jgi:hypothetical protein
LAHCTDGTHVGYSTNAFAYLTPAISHLSDYPFPSPSFPRYLFPGSTVLSQPFRPVLRLTECARHIVRTGCLFLFWDPLVPSTSALGFSLRPGYDLILPLPSSTHATRLRAFLIPALRALVLHSLPSSLILLQLSVLLLLSHTNTRTEPSLLPPSYAILSITLNPSFPRTAPSRHHCLPYALPLVSPISLHPSAHPPFNPIIFSPSSPSLEVRRKPRKDQTSDPPSRTT